MDIISINGIRNKDDFMNFIKKMLFQMIIKFN